MSHKVKRVLIIKTSSMGDVIHALPALTDAKRALPNIVFDWVVEKNFAQIPKWHFGVNRVIEVELRKWRKAPLKSLRKGDFQTFYRSLTQETYDYVIDAQGLLKSALIAFFARGERFGLDKYSARESYAALFYEYPLKIPKNLHAVTRVREMFAKVFSYACPLDPPDYGFRETPFLQDEPYLVTPYVVFLHGTTWETKLWPTVYWQKLGALLTERGVKICLPWGNAIEKARAETIAADNHNIQVLPPMQLRKLGALLAHAKAVVAVDTGLAHLASALGVTTYSIYGPTNPNLTGTFAVGQYHLAANFLCAPCLQKKCTYQGPSIVKPACFTEITPEVVLEKMLLDRI